MEYLPDAQSRAQAVANETSVTPPDISTLSPAELQKLFHELRIQQVNLESQNEELRKVQSELIESRDRYLDLYNFAPVGYLTVSKACNILEANQTVSGLFGMERDQLIGKSLYRLVAKEDQDLFHFHLITVFKNQATATCEIKLKRYDGTEFYAKLQSRALKVVNGQYNSFRTIVSDITQRKESEILQLKLQQNLESLWELSRIQNDDLKFLTDHVLEEIKRISGSRYAFYGFINHEETEMEIYSWSKDAMNQCKMDDKPKIFPIAKAGIWGRAIRQREKVIINDYDQDHEGKLGLPEGHVRLTRFAVIPVFSKDRIVAVGAVANKESDYTEDDVKQLEAFLAHVQIIAEQKIGQEDLRKSELKFRAVADYTCDWEYWVGPDGDLIYISPSCERITGYHRDEFLNNPKLISEIIHPEDQPLVVDHLTVIEENDCNPVDFRIVTRTGEERWISHCCQSVYGDNSNWLGRRVSNRDITQRKFTEEALRKSETNLRSFFHSISEKVFLMKPDGEILAANEPFATGIGKTAEDVIGHCVFDYLEPGVTARRRAWINEVVSSGKPMTIEDERQDSLIVHSIYPIFNSEGAVDRLAVYAKDVTEIRRSESARRYSEARFRLFVESANEGVWSMDGQFRATFVNRKMAEMLGYSPEEMLGRKVDSFMFEADSLDHQDRMAGRQLGRNESYERRFRRKDGAELWTLVSATAMVDENMEFQGSFAMFTDITERKRSEEAVKEIKEKFSKVFQYSPVLMTLSKADDGTYVEVNDKFCEVSGFSRSESIGKTALDFGWISAEDRQRLFAELHTHGSVRGLDLDVFTKDKRKLRCIYYGELIQTGKGPLLLSIALDMTDRKQMEEALRSSEAQKYAILNGISANISFLNDKLEILWANRTAAESVGRLPEDMIGATCYSLWAAPERPCSNCPAIKAFQTRRSQKATLTTLDGRILDERAEPVFDNSGNLIGVVQLAQDITEYKRLTDQGKLLSTAIEQAWESVVITDPTGTIQYVNPAAEAASGYCLDELIGKGVAIFNSGKQDKNFYKELWETINAGNVWSGRFINRRKDGTIYHEDATISPVYDKSGNLTNFVSVKRDMTKQVELQQQLLQAQKMEAIGTLSGGIAHDFNNLLQVVLGYSQVILDSKKEGEKDYSDVRQIYQAGIRGAELVKSLMTFSRKTAIQPKLISLNDQVEQISRMLARSIPKMIEIELLVDPGLATINADPTQIDLVLMNLAINAKDAMGEQGKLTFETGNVILDELYCKAHLGLTPGPYVLLAVSDSGQGMDRETVEHIFEPFFTTKGEGKGTGLGLSTVYGIVRQHNGSIECESELGLGTTFKIYLPATPLQGKACEETTAATTPRLGNETILVVDDEESVRDVVRRILSRAGYTVMTASNGEQALDLYKQALGTVSLVILDLMMPVMGGYQCLEELLNMDPGAKVLIATGLPMNDELSRLETIAGAKGCIPKPYNTSNLMMVVRDILDKD